MVDRNDEDLNQYKASKANDEKTEAVSTDERHNRNARESAVEQNYPKIDTENL
jgi:hypothetical protein